MSGPGTDTPVIPIPTRVDLRDGTFVFRSDTRVCASDPVLARTIADILHRECGTEIAAVTEAARDGDILVDLTGQSDGVEESYRLDVSPDRIHIRTGGAAGAFYAVQTLRQFLTPGGRREIFCCRVEDAPRFAWRGLMLDCSRHFMPVDFVKRILDQMALLKLNVFHWHLTDDHGWRVEIRRYPKLTEVGGFVESEEGRRGFYNQDEVREIVAYASERHIMVVPEIDMPGHSYAAMVSYPELCCTGRPERNAGHQKDLYCAGSEAAFEFIEGVLQEVVDLFPAPFVHVGGDEAPKDRWAVCPRCRERIRAEGLSGAEALQGYFTRRVGEMLTIKGRRLVGWEEIVFNDVPPPEGAVVHWWQRRTRGTRGIDEALARGLDVVSSPNIPSYLSFPVDPEGIFQVDRTFDLRDTYEGDPVPESVPQGREDAVLGGGACVWTEVLPFDAVETMIYPRLLATAERLWSPPDGSDFDGFLKRVEKWKSRLDAMGIQPGPVFRKNRDEA